MSWRQQQPPELMTQEEAAKYLRVGKRTLQRWAKEGIGPPSMKLPSGARRYRKSELDRWLSEQRAEE